MTEDTNFSEPETVSEFYDVKQEFPIYIDDQQKDGPSWEGEKLHPPADRAVSKAWKLGGFRKVNGILEKDFILCGVCGKTMLPAVLRAQHCC